MSTSLPARAAALRASLAALDAMGSNVQETSKLTDLREELRKQLDPLEQSTAQSKLLRAGGVAVPVKASLNTARERVRSVRTRFLADKKAATLTTAKHWTTLLKELAGAAADADSAAKLAWREHCDDAYTGEKPATLRSQLADTDHNRGALQRYEIKFQLLRSASSALPQSEDEISRVKQLGANLEAIAKEFDFEVPAAVKLFIDAVRAGGASLGLLTPEVLDWLAKNKQIDNYRIVTAR